MPMPETRTVVQKVRDAETYICIANHPCKIVEIRTDIAPAKIQFVAIDIFSGKVFKATFSLSRTCVVPHVTFTDYQLVDISEGDDPYVTLLDDKGNIKDDMKLPTDEALLSQINFGLAEGKDVYVSVMSAMGKEKIIALKGNGPRVTLNQA